MTSVRRVIVALIAAAAPTAGIAAQPNGPHPACSTEWNATWEFIREHQAGLALLDEAATRVTGPYAGRKKAAMLAPGAVWGKNWFPVDGYKHTVCGWVTDFTVFDPVISGAETDFHMFLNLAPPFAYALNDVAGISPSREFYGEITLPKPLRSEPWFKKQRSNPVGSSPTQRIPTRAPACGYGAWVTEEAHEMQPELHPMEEFWFLEGTTLHWVTAQDKSNRFDKAKYYCGISTPKKQCDSEMAAATNFNPWAQAKTRSTARLPFEADQKDAELKVSVGGQTASASVAASGAIRSGSSPRARIAPVELCSAGTALRGYFEVDLRVSDGFAHALLTGLPAMRRHPAPSVPKVVVDVRGAPVSIDEKGTKQIKRIQGVGYSAPTLNALGAAVEAKVDRLRVNASVDDVDPREGTLEFDISLEYVDQNGSDENPLAQFLTGALYGALPGVGPDTTPTAAQLEDKNVRFARAFGERRACFKLSARAHLNGTEIPVLPDGQCGSVSGLRVCQEENPCGFQRDGDLVDYQVHAEGNRGTLTIRGEIEDPAGLKAPFEMAVPLPIEARPPVEALVGPVIAEADLSAMDATILAKARPGQDSMAQDQRSLVCDAKTRAAREFWMLAHAFTRRGSLNSDGAATLRTILARFKTASPTCG